MDGTPEGTSDGFSNGAADGILLDSKLGLEDDNELGCGEGIELGLNDGIGLGFNKERLFGSKLGLPDGLAVVVADELIVAASTASFVMAILRTPCFSPSTFGFCFLI